MQAWGGIEIDNVNDGGVLTQLYPNWVAAGSGSAGIQRRRRPNEGVLGRMEVVPATGVGGTFELWDIAGELTGTNDVSAGNTLTNAFLTAEIAAGRARLLWKVDFSGDLEGSNKMIGIRNVFARGLAARYVQSDTPGDHQVLLNMSVDGGYQVWDGEVPA